MPICWRATTNRIYCLTTGRSRGIRFVSLAHRGASPETSRRRSEAPLLAASQLLDAASLIPENTLSGRALYCFLTFQTFSCIFAVSVDGDVDGNPLPRLIGK